MNKIDRIVEQYLGEALKNDQIESIKRNIETLKKQEKSAVEREESPDGKEKIHARYKRSIDNLRTRIDRIRKETKANATNGTKPKET